MRPARRISSLEVPRRREQGRRGSVYIAVLGVAMVTVICALAGMHLARSELTSARRSNDLHRAQFLAGSAVELAVGMMNRAPLDNGLWRNAYTSGVETTPITVGNGSLSFKLVDEDGNLAGDLTDPAWIYGFGRVGEAVWIERAWARNDRGPPLECLNTCLHCSGQLDVGTSKSLIVSGAPASTDGNLNILGTIEGDAHAVTKTGTGTITGTPTVPAERKGVPWPSIFDNYVARATQIPYSANMSKFVLARGANELSEGVNADGVYYIETTNRPLHISNARIHATLIINVGTSTLTLNNVCFMQPYRTDFPVLICKGSLVLSLTSSAPLSEATDGHNYNPLGAPYHESTDSDQSDSYPSEIRGLVHVIGALSFQGNYVHRGAIMVQGTASVLTEGATIYHDRNLIMNPPWGYSSTPNSAAMILQSQTWTRQASP